MPPTASSEPATDGSAEDLRRLVTAEVAVLRPRGVQDPELAERIVTGLVESPGARSGAVAGTLDAERAGELGIALLESAVTAVGGLEAPPEEAADPARTRTRELLARLAVLEGELAQRRADPQAVANQSVRALLRRALSGRAQGRRR
ncbi:hypothetical protein [Nocardioides pantholopis]|uniref:hypothetical protein n=1 Tax=Nocardioides pantholopis TaxID=2483798 RepID=UPI000F0985F1|nr:hypothetical protein [Nocardioides pantholopis]